MKAFMTSGTLDFLKKYVDKNPKINFHFMDSGASTLIYYENYKNEKAIFASGRSYEIIISSGNITEEGYVVMNNIPVSDESMPIFEDRFKRNKGNMDSVPGFKAFRLLKPLQGNTYVVFTQWNEKKDFENWKASTNFKQSHKNKASKSPGYYTDKPFVTTYSMIEEDLL